jgi:hypothetical protein
LYHTSHQTPHACNLSWTTHPLTFLELLFSATVCQDISLTLWRKMGLFIPGCTPSLCMLISKSLMNGTDIMWSTSLLLFLDDLQATIGSTVWVLGIHLHNYLRRFYYQSTGWTSDYVLAYRHRIWIKDSC